MGARAQRSRVNRANSAHSAQDGASLAEWGADGAEFPLVQAESFKNGLKSHRQPRTHLNEGKEELKH